MPCGTTSPSGPRIGGVLPTCIMFRSWCAGREEHHPVLSLRTSMAIDDDDPIGSNVPSTRREPAVSPRLDARLVEASCRDSKAGVPAGSSTIGWWMDLLDPCPATRQDPRDNRVRVPHFPCVELVAAPHRCRYRRQSLEDSSGDLAVLGDPDRAPNRLIDVGNAALPPTPNLIAEDPESAKPAHSDWTLRHHTSTLALQIRNRRLLDHEVTFWQRNDERRMVEIAPRTTGNES